ncbi:hypothetical protein [Robertmurraya siralis]|uniref:hypothetical protein n=1 Tax=Robertmurraya siralis TaxID=77777 RepID=UPI0010F7C187|nr:hypothetical protein [Robertmurraya siralis]
MNQISKEALDFLQEAKESFEKNPDFTTYRNKKGSFIALRTGMSDDCIMIYELGFAVGNFTQQLPRRNMKLIDYDEYEQLKKDKKMLANIISADVKINRI